jgi:hypothetical protein
VIDPQNGILAGLNCLVIGDDINLIFDTFCTRLFNTFFSLRLCLGIASFGILFTICCSACAGIRFYHFSTLQSEILPFSKNEESKADILNNENYEQKENTIIELQQSVLSPFL